MRKGKVRCGVCFLWFPSQHHLEAHEWVEHMTEEERREYIDRLKVNPKPVPPLREVFKGLQDDSPSLEMLKSLKEDERG